MTNARAADRGSLIAAHWTVIAGVFAAVCMLATGGIFVKLSVLDPIATGAWRVALAMPLVYAWLSIERHAESTEWAEAKWHHTLLLVLAGASLGIDLALWNMSFSYTTVANANLLANMVPFIVIPTAWYYFKERITRRFLVGALLTVVGLSILLGRKFTTGMETLVGDGLALCTAVFYAIYLLLVRQLRERYTTAYIMYVSGIGCLIVLVPLSLVVEERIVPRSFVELLPLLGLAAIAHVGGQGLLAQCLKYLSASLSSVLVLLQPVVAAAYAWQLFGEILTPTEFCGVAVCIVGLYVATCLRETGS